MKLKTLKDIEYIAEEKYGYAVDVDVENLKEAAREWIDHYIKRFELEERDIPSKVWLSNTKGTWLLGKNSTEMKIHLNILRPPDISRQKHMKNINKKLPGIAIIGFIKYFFNLGETDE